MALSPDDLEALRALVLELTANRERPDRIGLQIAYKQTLIAATSGTDIKLVAANPMRVVLGFAAVVVQAVGVFAAGLTPQLAGFPLSQSVPPVWLSVATHGTLPQLEWHVWNPAATANVTVWELIWNPPKGLV